MAINYKQELESAAKSMILVHDHHILIKMIVRMIVQKVNVTHAGILLHQKDKNTYILTVSRGAVGLKIPAGFARMDTDSPLIRFFNDHLDKRFRREGYLVRSDAYNFLRRKNSTPAEKLIIKGAIRQMESFGAIASISTFFRNELLGILLLGEKKNHKKFTSEELHFFVAIASDVAMAIRNARLFSDLESELDKKHRLFIHTTVALSAAIDAKDHYTQGHTARVRDLSLAIARQMIKENPRAFPDKFLENLQIAALLHDIGKIGIPEAILNKESTLTDNERNQIKEHPMIGITILQPINELEEALAGIKYHHERFDGTGYPEGLKANEIPLMAAIIAVADTFDAMTTDRPYRRALTKEEAATEMKNISGTQLNPRVVATFLNLFREGTV
ncbi:MAG: HD-GYP domain-containing protein [Candidatus Omnitrophica bacterium]|nr:HD-GYP domain-containing protein [Candidatus Omnitrophota bacterium]